MEPFYTSPDTAVAGECLQFLCEAAEMFCFHQRVCEEIMTGCSFVAELLLNIFTTSLKQ